ncbi:MAG: hypothetical protein Kow0031_09220 [Anaerolineae bacterium]
MKKQTFFNITIGLAATLCFFAAGLWLNLGQLNSAADAADQPAEIVSVQPSSVELFSFGDDNHHQILLDLASSPVNDYTLTTVSLDDPLTDQRIAVCTHTGVPVVSPPAPVVEAKSQPAAPSIWQRLSAWLNTSASDSYFVTLWAPADNAEAYTLVSGDGPTFPVVCSSLADEGV